MLPSTRLDRVWLVPLPAAALLALELTGAQAREVEWTEPLVAKAFWLSFMAWAEWVVLESARVLAWGLASVVFWPGIYMVVLVESLPLGEVLKACGLRAGRLIGGCVAGTGRRSFVPRMVALLKSPLVGDWNRDLSWPAGVVD